MHLCINNFTWVEWPEQELQSSETFSVGEEQSSSTVTWLAWSAPGLAKHKRSVLAILTSNHVLSLWASNSDMAVPESWERVYIVNYAVKNALREEKYKVGFSNGSGLRLGRIRSAAWAPLLDSKCADQSLVRATAAGPADRGDRDAVHGMNGDDRSRDGDEERLAFSTNGRLSLRKTFQLLAVANDCGGFYIMNLFSPFTDAPEMWEVRVVKMCSLPTQDYMIANVPQGIPIDDLVTNGLVEHQGIEDQNDTKRLNARPSLFAAAVSKKNFIEDICWSPWSRHMNEGYESSLLTIKRNGVLSMIALQISTEQRNIQCHCSDVKTRKRDLLQPAQRSSLWFHNVHLPALCRASLIVIDFRCL